MVMKKVIGNSNTDAITRCRKCDCVFSYDPDKDIEKKEEVEIDVDYFGVDRTVRTIHTLVCPKCGNVMTWKI